MVVLRYVYQRFSASDEHHVIDTKRYVTYAS